MQDHSGRLRKDRKGIMGLPIRLLVTMTVITLAIPIIAGAMDSSEENMAGAEMHQEIERFKNAASLAHYSGNGCSRTVHLDIPAGCEISVGGEGSDAYSIRSVYKGEIIATDHFERPALRIDESMTFTGRTDLKLTSIVTEGIPAIEVTVL